MINNIPSFSRLDHVAGFTLVGNPESEIMELEVRLQLSLPPSFVGFILQYGGASFHDAIVSTIVEGEPDSVSISEVFGFYNPYSDQNSCDYDMRHHITRLFDHLQPNSIPFAQSGDNIFVLNIHDKQAGAVWLMLPAQFADELPYSTILLFDRFDVFLSSLTSRL